MIRPFPVLASLALHAAVFSGVMLVEPRQEAETAVVPIEFQLVEESSDSVEAPMVDTSTKVDATAKVDATTSSRLGDESTTLDEQEPGPVERGLEEDLSQRRDEVVASTMGGASMSAADSSQRRDEVVASTVMAPPEALNRITPVYPKSARRRGREGSVTVEATIAADGFVEDIRVVSSSGYRELDESAVKAVSTARFSPATLAGATISASIRLTFNFKLGK